jgi:signal transduction histidine kinase
VRSRFALVVQAVLILSLLASSLFLLWQAGQAAVARDQRRAAALSALERAEEDLARGAAPGLLLVPSWPESLTPTEWDDLDLWLSEEARDSLRDEETADGGFYFVGFDRFSGRARRNAGEATGSGSPGREGPEPDPPYRGLVDAQIRQSLAQDRSLSILVEEPPRIVAVRTAPIWINGRRVAASWLIAEIDSHTSLGETVARFRLAASLALLGALGAMIVSVGFWWTARRQRAQREALGEELRRSERLASLGKLLAGVAHEVRNPLAAIRSTAQLAERGMPLDPESARDLIDEVDRLESLVSRLLCFSRVHHERLRPGSLNDVVADAARLARSQAEEQGVRVELDLDETMPAVLMSPPALLQVARNLISNALQAMPDGGRLDLATRHDAGLHQVVISVKDTGTGIRPENLRQLFEPFFTTKPMGTGLGLAIAREIALAHRGSLTAENRRDAPGAVFTLRLHALDPVGSPPVSHRLTAPGKKLPEDDREPGHENQMEPSNLAV